MDSAWTICGKWGIGKEKSFQMSFCFFLQTTSVDTVPLLPPSSKFFLSSLGLLWEEKGDRKAEAALNEEDGSGVGSTTKMATKVLGLIQTSLNSVEK